MKVPSIRALLLGVFLSATSPVSAGSGGVRELEIPGALPPILMIDPAKDTAVPGLLANRIGANREFALRTYGGTFESETAVARGLKWLVRQRQEDGRWKLDLPKPKPDDPAPEGNDVGATSLALLPFLAAGYTHKADAKNPYDKVIEKGLKFLLQSQDKKTGYFGGTMYGHGLATIAICEAYGLSKDPALAKPAQRAIDLIVVCQHENGGWRYFPGKNEGDMSIFGWQAMALKTGQAAGLDVPAVSIQRAKAFLNSCCNANEGYGYLAGSGTTPTMTAVGLLCRQHLENWGPNHPRMKKAVSDIIKPNAPDRMDSYYRYYATQMMFQLGGKDWQAWNEKGRDYLVQKQDKDAERAHFGSWSPDGDPWGRAGGRLMVTSLNLLTLQVYYRHAPLSTRPYKELDDKK